VEAGNGGRDNQVMLTWEANSDCDLAGYNIHRSTTRDNPDTTPINDQPVSASATAYTDTGLLGCVTYYYTITAFDFCGNESSMSVEAGAETIDTIPPLPPGETDVKTKQGSAAITWSLSEDDSSGANDVYGYRVYADGILVGTPMAGETSYYDSTGGKTVQYAVSAVDHCFNESDKILEGECIQFPSVAISSLSSKESVSGLLAITGTASAPGGRSIADVHLAIAGSSEGSGLDWVPVTGISSWTYVLDSANFPDGIYVVTARVFDSKGCTATDSQSIVINNPEPGDQLIYCQVHACKPKGSNPVHIKACLVDNSNDPITGATVTSDITSGQFSDLGNGWYGGTFTDACQVNGYTSARSDNNYKDKDLPVTFTITASTATASCQASTTIQQQP